MARRPITEMAGNPLRGVDAYWRIMLRLDREQGRFTLTDVERRTNAHRTTVRDYMRRLERAGFLRAVAVDGGATGRARVFELTRRPREAPRVRRDGTLASDGQRRDQMWRTAKIIKEFSPRDLAVQASTEECVVSEADAKDYCKYLLKAGYIAVKRAGRPGRQAVYRFLPTRNTGPKAPMVQRVKAVFDPNLRQVVWTAKEEA